MFLAMLFAADAQLGGKLETLGEVFDGLLQVASWTVLVLWIHGDAAQNVPLSSPSKLSMT